MKTRFRDDPRITEDKRKQEVTKISFFHLENDMMVFLSVRQNSGFDVVTFCVKAWGAELS